MNASANISRRFLTKRKVSFLSFTIAVALGLTDKGHSAAFVVSNSLDSGVGSLRDAITAANGTATHDWISFGSVTGRIVLASPLPPLSGGLDILGPGAGVLAISGGRSNRVFEILPGANVSISRLAVADGYATNSGGGAILNFGDLRLTDCLITNNTSLTGPGGAISSDNRDRVLTLLRCHFSGNSIESRWAWYAQGGAVFARSQSASIVDCAFVGNSVRAGFDYRRFDGSGEYAFGGAVYAYGGTLTLDRVTIVSNSVTGGPGFATGPVASLGGPGGRALGGGLYAVSEISMTNSTVSGNTATGGQGSGGLKYGGNGGSAYGGGLYLNDCRGTIQSCTVWRNRTEGGLPGQGSLQNGSVGSAWPAGLHFEQIQQERSLTLRSSLLHDWYGPVISGGHNWVQGTFRFEAVSSDITNRAIVLEPLKRSSSTAWTHMPPVGSPAIDAGAVNGPRFDQRGVRRPVGIALDIGAVERDLFTISSNLGSVEIRFDAGPNSLCVLEMTRNLTGPWQQLRQTNANATGSILLRLPTSEVSSPAFFRIRQP